MVSKISKVLFVIFISFFVLSIGWVMLYKYIPVKWTPLMLKRSIENISEESYRNYRTWVPIGEIAPVMIRAVIASEDGKFMEHNGFDFSELQKMRREHKSKGKKIRGCSTISQQVAKNCFTFCGRTWWRKGFETYYTVLIELLWSKERIMEVYLNVAETGKGVFGVEEAAMRNFNRHASRLNKRQAVSIACVFPNPLVRSPKTAKQKNKSKYNIVSKRTDMVPYPFND